MSTHLRMAMVVGVVLSLLLVTPPTARAQSEVARRLAVEFEIMLGNVRAIKAPSTVPLVRKGLHARLTSALGYLGITARRYLDQSTRSNDKLLLRIDKLKQEFHANRLGAFERSLETLTKAYPVDFRGILPLEVTSERLRIGRLLYREHCWGCHANPEPKSEYPAPNLFLEAHHEPSREFAARLLGGIYGNFYTSMDNPFSDEQLAALFAYFRSGTPPSRK